MDVLHPRIQPYAWGSRHGIAELQGRPVPAPGPEAELWMGAHPSAPSGIDRDGRLTTLDAVIAAEPEGTLGEECVRRFGERLPFLLKVLSARASLSIQVHPSRAQAQAGFRAENERGLPAGDPGRNYVDDWPKPELLYALTPFEVLAGLRPAQDAGRLLASLAVGRLRPLAARLQVGGHETTGAGARSVGDVLAAVLDWPEAGRAGLVADVVAACVRLAAGDGPYAGACDAAARIAVDHPGDLGVVASLLLRHAVLRPGQAVFMPACGLHAYLSGTGIELLGNSDNVVRAGLTGKHVDVPELLRLVDPAVEVPVLSPRALAGGLVEYDSPAPEFRLYRIGLDASAGLLPGTGPKICLCIEGTAELRSAPGDTIKIGRGESCFVAARDGDVGAAGPAQLFLATPGPVG